MILYWLIFLFLIYIYRVSIVHFFANIYYEIQLCWKFCKVSNNLSNWTSGRSIQLSELWNWTLIDNKRNEEKNRFSCEKIPTEKSVCCSWMFWTLTLHVFNIRNFFASKTSAYQLKLYPVSLFFFFFYSQQRKNLFHNAIFQQPSYSLINFSIVEPSYP